MKITTVLLRSRLQPRLKISVLTVCFNSEATIRHTLDSFCSQVHQDKEMIVIDGASVDRTTAIVKSYEHDGIILLSEPDRGMYDALNKGLAIYGGDAVGVLNSDDAFHDEAVLGSIARALTSTDIVFGHLDFVSDHQSKRIVRRWRAKPRPKRGFRTGWMPAHPTFYVKREVAEAVGSYDLRLRVASDYDWMLRAVEFHAFKTEMIDHVMVDMMHGGESTSGWSSYIRHNLEALRSRQQWLGAGWIDYALIAKPARKVAQLLPAGEKS